MVETGVGRSLLSEDAATEGDLGTWFVAEYPSLVRFAIAVCGDPHLAQDLVQDAFLRAQAAGARTEDQIGAYVRRIIVNLSRSRFRRLRTERRVLDGLKPIEPSEHQGRDDAVWQALLHLSARQRAVIALRYYDDLTDAGIAETLGIGEGSVRQHLYRATQRLRTLLKDGGSDDAR
jgi:RNA polymerase sigma factor (sigma-70 family)